MSDFVKYQHQVVDDEAAKLWEAITDVDGTLSRVDRFHPKFVPHEKSILFGYVDLTLVVKTCIPGIVLPIKLRGLVVKSLKGKAWLDMPAQRGADGEFYDQFMPRSLALRQVLTALVFAHPQVMATIEEVANEQNKGISDDATDVDVPEEPAVAEAVPELEVESAATFRADNPFAPTA